MKQQEFYDSYNEFLRTGNPNDPPPVNWAPPAGPIKEYADFFGPFGVSRNQDDEN